MKTYALRLITVVAFFGGAFFVIGSISTGLHSVRYDYRWFFGEHYGIRPTFVPVIAIASVISGILLPSIIKKIKNPFLMAAGVQALFLVCVLVINTIKTIVLDGWGIKVFELLTWSRDFLTGPTVLSVIFIPASLLLGVLWFCAERDQTEQ